MSLSAVIGALRVDLGMETAEFHKGVKEVKDTLSETVSELKTRAKELAEAFAIYEIVEAFMKVNESIDQMGKTAQKIGIPVDQLSKLEYAAKLADVPVESLVTSMEKFDKGLSAGAATGKGSVADALKTLGINAKDANGQMKPQIEILQAVAEKFSTHADGANKAALAMALFGKQGAEMIPLLNKGKEGIKESADQLNMWGGVVDGPAAQAAEHFMDDLKQIKQFVYSMGQQVVVVIDQVLNPLMDSIIGLVNTEDKVREWRDYFVGALVDIGQASLREYTDLMNLGDALKYVTKGYGSYDLGNALFHQDLDQNEARYSKQISKLEDLRHAQESVNRDRQDGSGASVGKSEQKKLPDLPAYGQGMYDTKKVKEHKDAAAELIKTLQLQNEEFGKGVLQMQIDENVRKAGKNATVEQIATIKELTIEHAKAQAAQQTYLQQIANSEKELAATTDFLKGKFQGWFDDAIGGTFDLKNSLLDLAKSIASMGFQNLLSNVFSVAGGNSLYGGGGAGGILGGLGKILGFATGGTILPGGTGGIDSQLVMFHKSPDERVDITRPGQTLSSGGGGPDSLHININLAGANGDASVAAIAKAAVKQGLSEFKRQLPQINIENRLRNA